MPQFHLQCSDDERQLSAHRPHHRLVLLITANYIYWPPHLGHRELSMTERYAHLSPDHMKRIASLMLRRPGAKLLGIARGRKDRPRSLTPFWITQIL